MKKPDNGVLPIGGGYGVSNRQIERTDSGPSQRAREPAYANPQTNYNPYGEPEVDRNDLAGNRGGYEPYKYDQYEPETAAQRNQLAAGDEEEFQRRLEEYRRADANLGQANLDLSGPDVGRNNPYAYQDEFPQYARDQNPSYQPPQESPYNMPPQDYEPYGRERDAYPLHGAKEENPYRMGGNQPSQNGQGPQLAADDRKQRNYLVNNPIAPDAPQRRATGGFRAHQDITHDNMGIARPNKVAMTQGTASEAYANIKKKYGNHSAQYNILTGS